jgi:hypothetical protein
MAYIQADLDQLDKAIAGAELEVQYGEKRVKFRSMAELMAARTHVAGQLLAASQTKPRSRIVRVRHGGKGLR